MIVKGNKKRLLALTGLTRTEFEELLPTFDQASRARWIQELLPPLIDALDILGVLREREPDKEKQALHYSGKH
jgi:hypothetical protein